MTCTRICSILQIDSKVGDYYLVQHTTKLGSGYLIVATLVDDM